MGHLFGIDEVSGAPVALYEPPGAGHVNGVPAVTESIVLEPDARLVSGRLAVALDDDAVETGVTAETLEQHVVGLGAVLDTPQQTHRGVAP